MQTLAYLLPVLTMALQKAEAEFEELAKKGKAHTAGVSHSALSLKAYHVRKLCHCALFCERLAHAMMFGGSTMWHIRDFEKP